MCVFKVKDIMQQNGFDKIYSELEYTRILSYVRMILSVQDGRYNAEDSKLLRYYATDILRINLKMLNDAKRY